MKKYLKLISLVLTLAFFASGCAKIKSLISKDDPTQGSGGEFGATSNVQEIKIEFSDNPIDRDNFKSKAKNPGITNKESLLTVKLLGQSEAAIALDFVIEKIDENLVDFTKKYPSSYTTDGVYKPTDKEGLTEGYWTGMLWLAFLHTGDSKYKGAAEIQCKDLALLLDNDNALNSHDIGSLYYLSCVKGYEITQSNYLKETALKAADKLLERYNENGKFIQSWGVVGTESENRLAIEEMMSLELLYWASNITGDSKYKDAAYEHAKTTAMVILRPDASTYHTYYINPQTGNPSHPVTVNGLSDDSAWARGQAYGLYGFARSYKHTEDVLFMEEGKKIANYFLNKLPGDYVSYWDLSFKNGNEPRDTSAAAIAASGLFVCAQQYGEQEKEVYKHAAYAILRSLINDYTTKDNDMSNSVLAHGVYSKPQNKGVDESLIFGDYYYMEALMRACNTDIAEK